MYDFDTYLDRSHDGSVKWNAMHGGEQDSKPGVVPMSVPETEFKMAPEIRDGLKAYLETVVQGEAKPSEAYVNAVLRWQAVRHRYAARKEWLVTASGVIPAIFALVKVLTSPGDGVIIQEPGCWYNAMAVKASGRNVVVNPLVQRDGRYEIDFENLLEKARDPANKVLIFSNPGNPTGRVWPREDLEHLVKICWENHIFIIDDESFQDVIMPGKMHTVLPSVSQEASRICALCTSPGPGFSTTGFELANIFIEDPSVREKLNVEMLLRMTLFQSPISYEACRLAYTKAEPWLNSMIDTVKENAAYVKHFLEENIPQARMALPEGSYLLWIDLRGLGLNHKELEKLMADAEIYPDDGPMFGPSGRGFECLNIALPRKLLESAMERLAECFRKLQEQRQQHGAPEHITLEDGMELPDFQYDTPYTSGLQMRQQCAGKKTILLFHRYYSCRICRTCLDKIKEEYSSIERLGAQVKVVIESTPESVFSALGNRVHYPFELICDPQRKLYNRFNVFPADSMFTLPGEEVLDRAAMVYRMYNSRGAKAEGDRYQVPAWFVIGEDGRICYSLYCSSLSQKPDREAMRKALSDF